jgi:hypothetical protein
MLKTHPISNRTWIGRLVATMPRTGSAKCSQREMFTTNSRTRKEVRLRRSLVVRPPLYWSLRHCLPVALSGAEDEH